MAAVTTSVSMKAVLELAIRIRQKSGRSRLFPARSVCFSRFVVVVIGKTPELSKFIQGHGAPRQA
jgi:hypothetical protein